MLKYHIQTIEVGSGGAGSIVFSNIPQEYDDLELVLSARNNSTATADSMLVSFNSSTSGFSGRLLYGVGSGSGVSVSVARYFGTSVGGTPTANTFSSTKILIPNYTSSSQKSYSLESVTEGNETETYQYLYAGLWANTSPISSISLVNDTSNSASIFIQYSSASLYGIKHGTSGEVSTEIASGGIMANSGGYTYHTFKSSDSFAVNQSVSAEVLVIGGGGAGGSYDSGGGGAGGLCYHPSLQIEAGQYPILVGAGGSSATRPASITSSSNSFALGITAYGGGFGGTYSQIGGQDGGSGGGGNAVGSGTGGSPGQSTQTSNGGATGYGNPGGIGGSGNPWRGGGGGGAGEAGNTDGLGHGGDGLSDWSAWATATSTGVNGFYAGGGSGGSESSSLSGGAGGGGTGAGGINVTGGSGAANTGGGGGGTGWPPDSVLGGNGGSGIVIIRYLTP